MKRPALRTGVRWKISIAIAAVGALTAVALSFVVHNAARVSMLENAREVQLERLTYAQLLYEATKTKKTDPRFGAKLNDPTMPRSLRTETGRNRRATHVEETAKGVPDVWAAVPVGNGDVLSLHTRFAYRSSTIMRDLDRALIIGSVSVVFGGCALGVLIGGQLSRRLRKAAAAAGRVAQGNTEVRVREAVGGVVQDETDELAGAVDALTDALNARIEAERRVTADIAHELRTPVTGLLTAAELLPDGRPTELVRDRAQAMRTLVEDVLEVARLDSASERAELQEIALGEFVEAGGSRCWPRMCGCGSSTSPGSTPIRAGWNASSAICWATPPSTAPPRWRSRSRAGWYGSATTAPGSRRRCCGRGRAGSVPGAVTGPGAGTVSG